MDALWPNQDGLSWAYAQHYEDYDEPADHRQPHSDLFRRYDDRRRRDQAQYLHQEPIGDAVTPVAFHPGLRDPFLRHLWVARPDLREKILRSDHGCALPGRRRSREARPPAPRGSSRIERPPTRSRLGDAMCPASESGSGSSRISRSATRSRSSSFPTSSDAGLPPREDRRDRTGDRSRRHVRRLRARRLRASTTASASVATTGATSRAASARRREARSTTRPAWAR